jgi:hypothetical protein
MAMHPSVVRPGSGYASQQVMCQTPLMAELYLEKTDAGFLVKVPLQRGVEKPEEKIIVLQE